MKAEQFIRNLIENPLARDYWDVGDQLKNHVYRRSLAEFAKGDARRDAIRRVGSLRRRQREVRRFFLQCLGGLPPMDTPLNARKVGEVQGPGFTVEKIIFESRPGTFVTSNLYLPAGRTGRTGAVLFVCGHYPEAKQHPQYQTVCQHLVQSGLVVLAMDPIGQGERFSYHDPKTGTQTVKCCCPEHDYAGVQCLPLGQTIGRYFVHDAMRAVDYLASRPEVDPEQIGMTGNSGGGTQTAMMMLADPRVKAAAPGTFIMSRESYLWTGMAQDAEQIWPGFTTAGYDHEDILLAMCPKPVRVLAVQSDFFPIEGTRRTVERCQRFWKLSGRSHDLDLVEDASVHLYTPKLAAAAAEFFARHLLGRKKIAAARVKTFPPEKLWCTQSGQVIGELSGARTVHHECRDRVAELSRRPSGGRKAALDWLRQRVLGQRKACDLNPRFMETKECADLAVTEAFWWSQPRVLNNGLLFRSPKATGRLPVTLAVWEGGTSSTAAHLPWIRGICRKGGAVLVLDVTGCGVGRPNLINPYPAHEFYGVFHRLADDLLWLGDDLAALRTYDVLRALDVVALWPGLDPKQITCYAHGNQGLYGELAAALDQRIKQIRIEGGLGSFAALCSAHHYPERDIKSVILRGVLEHFDLPELRAFSPAVETGKTQGKRK